METIAKGTSGASTAPENKKSIKKIVVIVVIICILLVTAGVFVFIAMRNGISLSVLPERVSLPRETPIGIPSMAVTQKIPAAEGGQINVTLPSGYVATLSIPKGSLKKDTTITITPFAPPGANAGNQNPPAQNPPGQNPPGNQPPGGNPPGGNPPGGGGGNNPPGGGGGNNPPGNNPPGSDPDEPGDFVPPFIDPDSFMPRGEDIPPLINPFGGGIGGVIITPDDLVFDPAATIFFGHPTSGGQVVVTAEPPTGVLVYTDPDGEGSIVPGAANGGSYGGPISGGGSISGDPPSQDEAEGIAADAAQASGGTCSPEFIAAVREMEEIPTSSGDSLLVKAIEDCINLDWLRDKCQNDPVALRRLYFEQRLRIAQALRATEAANEISRLENECVARYEVSTSAAYSLMSGTADIWVCGYVDDAWQGRMTYGITPHYFSGVVESLYLPPQGGAFGANAHPDPGGHFAGNFDLSGIDLGLWGYFDGNRTLNPITMYAVSAMNVPITMTEQPCVPLAPIGN